LMEHFKLEDLIEFFVEKFLDQRQLISIPQALVYFDDAENSPDPICLKGLEWEEVKRKIQKNVNLFVLKTPSYFFLVGFNTKSFSTVFLPAFSILFLDFHPRLAWTVFQRILINNFNISFCSC